MKIVRKVFAFLWIIKDGRFVPFNPIAWVILLIIIVFSTLVQFVKDIRSTLLDSDIWYNTGFKSTRFYKWLYRIYDFITGYVKYVVFARWNKIDERVAAFLIECEANFKKSKMQYWLYNKIRKTHNF